LRAHAGEGGTTGNGAEILLREESEDSGMFQSAANQLADSGVDIAAAHQRFANQYCPGAAFFQSFHVGARVNAAFGDEQRGTGILPVAIFIF
jgi:hypothetical protein